MNARLAVVGAVVGCLVACSAFSTDDLKPTDVTVDADGGVTDGSKPVMGTPGAQIELSVDDTKQLEVLRGDSATARVTVKRLNGSSGEVLVSVDGLPKGIHADPISIPSGEAAGTLKIVADGTSAQGLTAAKLVGVYATEKNLLATPAVLSILVRGKPGTLDETFGVSGVRESSALEGLSLVDVAEQPDGKIVFLARAPAEPSVRLGRLTADGTLDTTFGSGGLVSSTLGGDVGSVSPPSSLIVEPKGEIFVAGDRVSLDAKLAIRHFTASGANDVTFGTGGLLHIAPPIPSFHLSAVRQAEAGKLVAVGGATKGSSQVIAASRVAVARFERSGALDSSFGSAGLVTVERSAFSGATKLDAVGLAMTKDVIDVIVIASEGPANDLRGAGALIRLDANGVNAPLATRTDVFGVASGGLLGVPICERANGAGPLLGFSTDTGIHLFAFASDGVSNANFNQDVVPVGGIGNIFLDPLGRALYTVSDGGLKLTVRRNLPSGLVDKTFGVAGVAQAPAGAATAIVSVVTLSQRDGRILVGGHRKIVGDDGLTFARFWQ